MAIWAELKKVVNSNFSMPLNTLVDTWGNTLKTLIDSYRPWYATYGTTITLKSTTTAQTIVCTDTSDYDSDYTKILDFVAPKNGHYRIDINVKATSTYQTSSTTTQSAYVQATLDINEGTKNYMPGDYGWYYKKNTTSSEKLTVNVEKQLATLTIKAFFEEGKSYKLSVGCHCSYDTQCSATLTDAKVRYVKTASETF